MTIEEAIKRYNEACANYAAGCMDGWAAPEVIADRKENYELFEIGRDAIIAQQERDNPQPLTLDELRQMDGQPVFVADKLNSWEIVIVDNSGIWSGIPFVQGKYFNYNVKTGELHCYRYPPKEAHP